MDTTALRQKLEENVNVLNSIIATRKELGDKYEDAYTGAKEEVENALKLVNQSKMCDYFKVWLEDELPVRAFILNYRVTDAIKVKSKRDTDTGKITNFELDTGVAMYDIADFVRFAAGEGKEVCTRGWGMLTSRLNLLLHLRVMQDTNSVATLKKLDADFTTAQYHGDIAQQIKDGKTPLSNTQMQKLLQEVIDKYLFIPTDKGDKNKLKPVNVDIYYLLHSITRNVDQKKIAVCDDKTLRRYVCDVMNRLLTKDEYYVERGKIETLNSDPE